MADSHGDPETILAALDVFQGMDCRRIYHLGDVCDSTRPETVEACLEPLQKHGVITIKGNNDHTFVANHIGRKDSPIAPGTLKYIQCLPLVIEYQDAIFTHSLPFADELGLSCMIGSISEPEAFRTFDAFPRHIIFRGHSHKPEILFLRGRSIESSIPAVGRKISLAGKRPCVVTCGALTRGLYMIWNPAEKYITSHSYK